MPHGDVEELCRTLAHDVCTLFRKQPVLGVILLADGAPELWKLLTGSLNAETLGVPVRQLVDLWHLLEKLGSAARLLYGEAQGSAVLHGWRLRLLNRTEQCRRDPAGIVRFGQGGAGGRHESPRARGHHLFGESSGPDELRRRPPARIPRRQRQRRGHV